MPSQPPAIELPDDVGLVVIGRNEGARLVRSLDRLGPNPSRTVYADSGSTDGSASVARARGIDVLELDSQLPFTAARSRNEGFAHIRKHHPEVRFVQFLDGDCVLDEGWLEAAAATMRGDSATGVVTGVLREMFPEASVFNRLCDMEWNGPTGEILSCGGNAMIRAEAYAAAGGMCGDLIAGEEADLHLRLKHAGQRTLRIDRPMARHDADMHRISQWWTRNVRGGHATAESAKVHGGGPERHMVRERRSNWLWGLALPGASVALAPVTLGLSSLLVSAGYPALYAKILLHETRRGVPLSDAELYARFTVLGKLPQALGQLTYEVNRLRGRRSGLFDKRPVRASGNTDTDADADEGSRP